MIFNVAGIASDSMVCSIIDLKISFTFFFYHATSAILNLECKIVVKCSNCPIDKAAVKIGKRFTDSVT